MGQTKSTYKNSEIRIDKSFFFRSFFFFSMSVSNYFRVDFIYKEILGVRGQVPPHPPLALPLFVHHIVLDFLQKFYVRTKNAIDI